MTVCIVTVYNSINSGSYWQAKALGFYLEQKGFDVCYLERNGNKASSSKKSKITKLIKSVLKMNFSKAKRLYLSFRAFEEVQKEFSVIPNVKDAWNDIDCFILGSDTIWNLDSSYFSDNYRKYWGADFIGHKVISYAASVGNTDAATCAKYADLPKIVDTWSAIGVRDKHTFDIISELTKKPVKMVCDPTLLLCGDDYKKFISESIDGDYIFVYTFSDLTKSQKSEVIEFAKKKKLRIISGVHKFDFCDDVIVNTPYMFLKYMINAKYVITDTFHGTVFSANLQKQFVVINREKNKVNDFLKDADFTDRLICGDSSLIELFSTEIEYNDRMQRIDEMRKASTDFLSEALRKS